MIGDWWYGHFERGPGPDRSRPTHTRTLFRDEQRRRLTRPESRLAARGGSGLTHMCGSTRALRPVVREEGRADPVREVRLCRKYHWGVTRGPAKQAVEGDCSRYPHPSSPDRLPMPKKTCGSNVLLQRFEPRVETARSPQPLPEAGGPINAILKVDSRQHAVVSAAMVAMGRGGGTWKETLQAHIVALWQGRGLMPHRRGTSVSGGLRDVQALADTY